MVFIVRVMTPVGTKRLYFENGGASFHELQLQLQDQAGIPIAEQSVSKQRKGSPLRAKPSQTLSALGLRHGDMLYVVTGAQGIMQGSAAKKEEKYEDITSRCMHGPRGRCLHCSGVEPGGLKQTQAACNHGSNATCPNCSSYVKERAKQAKADSEEVAAWLCNHPDTSFCPKCLPKEVADDTVLPTAKCSCNKSKGQQCIHCVDKGPKIKVAFQSYKLYMKEKRAICKFSHSGATKCASCADPVMPSYRGKANCTRGHKPWPYGVCLSCAPPNAHLRLQPYRHCDRISFYDQRTVQSFYMDWARAGTFQSKAAVLFGEHIPEPADSKLAGSIRANVYSLYVPPQQQKRNGGIRFVNDPRDKVVKKVARACGLSPVGWMVATLPRSGDKYGGKVFLSGSEIRQAAVFQGKYCDKLGHSQFVTVVLEHGDNVEPLAYQVSDQAVAMERDRLLTTAKDPYLLSTRIPKQGELLPSVVYKDKPLLPGTPFIPDELMVKLAVTVPTKPRRMFRYCSFPSNGGDQHFRSHMAEHSKDPYHVKLSDFNLLCYLASVTSVTLVEKVAKQVVNGQMLDSKLQGDLDSALASKNLL